MTDSIVKPPIGYVPKSSDEVDLLVVLERIVRQLIDGYKSVGGRMTIKPYEQMALMQLQQVTLDTLDEMRAKTN